jgi:hypothetical protein
MISTSGTVSVLLFASFCILCGLALVTDFWTVASRLSETPPESHWSRSFAAWRLGGAEFIALGLALMSAGVLQASVPNALRTLLDILFWTACGACALGVILGKGIVAWLRGGSRGRVNADKESS